MCCVEQPLHKQKDPDFTGRMLLTNLCVSSIHASSCNEKNTIFHWNNRPCLPWSRAILCFQSDLVQEAFSVTEAHTILEPSKMDINFAVQILCISMLDPFTVQISMVKPFDLQKQFFLTPFENVAIYQTSQSSLLILQSKKCILIHILITYSLQKMLFLLGCLVFSQNI